MKVIISVVRLDLPVLRTKQVILDTIIRLPFTCQLTYNGPYQSFPRTRQMVSQDQQAATKQPTIRFPE